MIHTYSDTKVGECSKPTGGGSGHLEGDVWVKEYVEYDARETFLADLDDRKLVDWKEEKSTQSLFHQTDTVPEGDAYHKNFLLYLEKCWADHLGVVVTPDSIWYMLLCELAALVKGNPERYRTLFTESDGKQDIIVLSGSLVEMPLDVLVGSLKDYVPTDTEHFLPEFSTSTERSQHAFNAAFCDICSPYYNYMMLLCGFPYIDVRGTKEDYATIAAHWKALSGLIGTNVWTEKVQQVLNEIVAHLDSPEFWKKMFYLERCGSGSDVEAYGWITNLYREQPRTRYPSNFSPHVSIVKYKQLDTGKDYEMRVGLFCSRMEGDFLVPDYGYVIHEKTEQKTVFGPRERTETRRVERVLRT